ncbi:MAG: sigma-54-dependent Fis family transcriptional regulator [Cellvibrionaceae bacterium]|nr:sigma-54-dependent Fis family transcriptional regulator [Cellvibrionaceae bacterium]
MWREIKILVIDDDDDRRHDLKVVLDFLGEPTVVANSFDWLSQSEVINKDALMAVFVGACRRKASLDTRLADIVSWNDNVAIILLEASPADSRVSEKLDARISQRIIASLETPPSYNKLLDTLYRAQCFQEVSRAAKQQTTRRPPHLFRSLVGTSRCVQNVREMMGQVADKDVTVLITGQSGTGKEVVARNLHYHSPRREAPFVPVNCGAIPSELLESELFGHEKGAFTGAISARAGRFELAEGGTLFLDEIGDMPLSMQVKILRVLQEKSYERVGSNKSQSTNVRIIAATHRNLEEMIEKGSFREDLYYRLNVFPIEMPSLNDRREDIPLLLTEIVARLENEQRGSVRFNSAAIMSLCQHQWAGNVRELANLVERMAIMHPYGVIGVNNLPPKYRHLDTADEAFDLPELVDEAPSVVNLNATPLLPDAGIDLKDYLTGLEQGLIQQALDDSGGVVARAAERLSIRRTTLVEKMRKYGMQRA